MKKIKKKKGKNRKKRQAADEDIGSYYLNVLEELTDFNDWCISDKSDWGIPVPFFRFKDSGKILMDQEIIEHFASLVEHHGTSDIWYSLGVEDLLPMRYKERTSELEKQYQVFDSWFDSSLSWNFVLKEHGHYVKG